MQLLKNLMLFYERKHYVNRQLTCMGRRCLRYATDNYV